MYSNWNVFWHLTSVIALVKKSDLKNVPSVLFLYFMQI